MWSREPLTFLAVFAFFGLCLLAVALHVTKTPVSELERVVTIVVPPLLLIIGRTRTMASATVKDAAADIARASAEGSHAEATVKALALATKASKLDAPVEPPAPPTPPRSEPSPAP